MIRPRSTISEVRSHTQQQKTTTKDVCFLACGVPARMRLLRSWRARKSQRVRSCFLYQVESYYDIHLITTGEKERTLLSLEQRCQALITCFSGSVSDKEVHEQETARPSARGPEEKIPNNQSLTIILNTLSSHYLLGESRGEDELP